MGIGEEGITGEWLNFNVPITYMGNVIRVLPLIKYFLVRNDNHSYPPTIPKRRNVMIKAGDIFKNIENGIIFTVKSVGPRIIILGSKDGSHSMFVNPNSIETQFVPIIEDEGKEKLKG